MPLTPTQSDAMVDAIRAVAADEIRPRFRNLPPDAVDEKRAFDDLVTVADRAAEEALTRRVRAILPGDAVIGEESISDGTASLDAVAGGRCVVIDPIDGTWNFAHGLANHGVIVAVVEDGQTVWGCLYDPGFDDWVLATRGGGCHFHRNGTARRLSTTAEAGPKDRMRGNLGEYFYGEPGRTRLAALTPGLRRNTNLGASVHEYRLLCLGGSDFVVNGGINVWDHAAGVLCLREAGGRSGLLDGRDYAPTMTDADLAGSALFNARSSAVWEMMAPQLAEALS
ncbi:inositol monophosphatase family protein [Jannaschia aquimarina]|uniref:SuhB_3 protein n=1 Tax=Jannaschia aquimarina TaxID=935700 RepID=A0A0D1EG77_9RHOB|nr:inositol monophosphatase [Jannaschia aquimarina]KIT14820.1 Inositol-1-monophosphatase [Jannaschia aquimarina]SNS56873.1 fructose-1,6-bisphosphatase [Jannaschia aquimarina]